MYIQADNDQTAANDLRKAPSGYRTVTHLHTSFSHDSKFGSEPNLQLRNLKDQGYQAVFVTEHDHSTMSSAQTDFFVPPFSNGGFETGEPYPNQWTLIRTPRASAEYLNLTDSNLSFEGEKSFHLRLKGNEDSFDVLSWAYKERGEDRIRERSIAYNLSLKFSLYRPNDLDPNSTTYICSIFGRRDDPSFPQITNSLCFYFSKESWEDRRFFGLTNSTGQMAIRLEPPTLGKWESYTLNLTDQASQLFDELEGIPTKYLFLRQVTLNLASKNGAIADIYVDDFQVYSDLTPEEMYDWWKKDIESYSDDNFLVIAGLETTHKPADIVAYGLEAWHDFSNYSIEDRVQAIKALGGISSITSPRAHNFTNVKEGGGWGAEFFEIFNTVHDSKPSIQVLKGWDHFLSQGATVFGIVGFDSHGLNGTPGERNPTVVREPVYENIVLARSLSRDDMISALRDGHLYVIRSDHPTRMSFSLGQEILPQVGGVVYTKPGTNVAMNVYMEGITPTSQLFVIQEEKVVREIDMKEDAFHAQLQVPLLGDYSYVRLEIHHLGERVLFSNPIILHKALLPEGFWISGETTISKITSINTSENEIRVEVASPSISSSILRVHSPKEPTNIILNENELRRYELHVLDNDISQGWNYEHESKILMLKFQNENIITIQYGDTKLVGQPSYPSIDSVIIGIALTTIGVATGIVLTRKYHK
jgi:hypothetical protein